MVQQIPDQILHKVSVDGDLNPASIGSSQQIVYIKLNKSVLARFLSPFLFVNSMMGSTFNDDDFRILNKLKSDDLVSEYYQSDIRKTLPNSKCFSHNFSNLIQ